MIIRTNTDFNSLNFDLGGYSYTLWTFTWISEPSLTYSSGQSWWCGGEPNNGGGNPSYIRENVIQIARESFLFCL